MAEVFSIFSETDVGFDGIVSKNHVKGLKKKALGDVGNTLQTIVHNRGKRNLQNSPSADTSDKGFICQKTLPECHALPDSALQPKDSDEVKCEDICGDCQNPKEDTYEDIRPLCTRLDEGDMKYIIQNLWRPPEFDFHQYTCRSPSPPVYKSINDLVCDTRDFMDKVEMEEVKMPTYYDLDFSS